MVAAPFAAIISDRYGRRKGMFVGALVIIIGSVIATTSKHVAQVSMSQCFDFGGDANDIEMLIRYLTSLFSSLPTTASRCETHLRRGGSDLYRLGPSILYRSVSSSNAREDDGDLQLRYVLSNL